MTYGAMKDRRAKSTILSDLGKDQVIAMLFSGAGIILVANLFLLFFRQQGLMTEITPELYLGGLVNWFNTVILAVSALVSLNIARLSARVRDHRTWVGLSLVLMVLSAIQVVNVYAYYTWPFQGLGFVAANPMLAVFVVGIPVLWLASRLASALFESFEAARSLLFGSIFFLGGGLGKLLLVSFYSVSLAGILWPLEMVVYEAFSMFGCVILLLGFFTHERYVHSILRRVESGRTHASLPLPRTQTAAWAMRMLGTPTALSPADSTEAVQPRNRRTGDK